MTDAFGVLDPGGDELDLGTRDLLEKLIVIFDANLLNAVERVPAMLDNVVKVLPSLVVVELPCCLSADAPDLIKRPRILSASSFSTSITACIRPSSAFHSRNKCAILVSQPGRARISRVLERVYG
jgi:hypothetical protein